jgi:hypothetical protein
VVEADNNATPLNMSKRNVDPSTTIVDQQFATWSQKPLHGRYPNETGTQPSYKWLSVGSLYVETEGFMIAIQDKVIATKNYRKFIMRDSQLLDDKFRKCNAASERIQHMLGGCGVLSQTEYKARHDAMGKIIHRALALHHKLLPQLVEPYYKYTPTNILENNNIKLYTEEVYRTTDLI